MGVAEIIGFAACWLVVASLMLWGVFTERRRGPAPLFDAAQMHPSRAPRPAASDWIVVEAAEGGSPEVAAHARFLAGAWLASRGIDIETLAPADIRTDVTSTGDGLASTRILVRAGAVMPARRSRRGA